MINLAKKTLATKKCFAMLGATQDMLKYGYELLFTLLNAGYVVFPINPKYEKIENITCYPGLHALPEKAQVVLMVLAPQNTEKLVKQVIDYSPDIIWMPPGSWTENAVKTCELAGKQVLYNVCPIGTLKIMGKIL